MSAWTRSRSFGCDTPEGLRPIERTDSTSGSRRHWRRTLLPTMPVEPKRITFIHTSPEGGDFAGAPGSHGSSKMLGSVPGASCPGTVSAPQLMVHLLKRVIGRDATSLQ